MSRPRLRTSSTRPGRARRLVLVALTAAGVGGPVACRDEPSSPGSTPPVATILLAGVPTAALRVGGTAQVAATALSATGSTINGAPVTWKSSDEAVAKVSGGGLVTALAAGRATVTASSGVGKAEAAILVVAPLTLTPSGGTATLPGGGLSLAVAPGVLRSTVTLLVGPAADSMGDDKVVPGTIFQIAPEGDSGSLPPGVTLSLRFDPARLPAGVAGGALQLHARTGSGWAAVRGSASDPAARVVTGAFTRPGTYAARHTPVDGVALSGMLVDGAIYAGQGARIQAAALSALGDTLANRAATWSTSAPDVATVDAQGAVTGVRPGIATVTATIEGATGTAQVQVLARPVASWTGTLDWTTFRGGNRRTGYVDATLDPVVFVRRWEVTPATPAGFNEPATGDGNVYVSTSFGAQALWALDPSTGAMRWTRAFGDIHSVNGPASGNGRVYLSTGGHQDSFLWSFDAASGAVRFRSAYGNQWSRWQAPAVTADIVFLGGGYYGGMSAFDALDGALRWRRDLPQQDEWTPSADAGRTYAFGGDGSGLGLLAIDGPTGTATLKVPNLGLPTAATPVLGGLQDVYAIRGSRLLALDLARNVVTWDRPGAYQGVPALDAANVYAVVNGQVEARGRTDGSLVWTWVPEAGLRATGSVIVTRNLVFVRLAPPFGSTRAARVVALDLGARKVVWSHDAEGEMALGNGLLVIASSFTGKVTAIAVR